MMTLMTNDSSSSSSSSSSSNVGGGGDDSNTSKVSSFLRRCSYAGEVPPVVGRDVRRHRQLTSTVEVDLMIIKLVERCTRFFKVAIDNRQYEAIYALQAL